MKHAIFNLVGVISVMTFLFSFGVHHPCNAQNPAGKIFKGTWEFHEEDPTEPYEITIKINLYEKNIEHMGEDSYGWISVNSGLNEGNGTIYLARVEGNKAYIEYADESTLFYSAQLIYNPANKQLKFVDGEALLDKYEKEFGKLDRDNMGMYNEFHRAFPYNQLLNKVPLEKAHPLSARKGLGIWGQACRVYTKSTADKHESNYIFDQKGNIEYSEEKGVNANGVYDSWSESYTYNKAKTEYTINDYNSPTKIIYTDHARKDEGNKEYFFDNQDRVIKTISYVNMTNLTTTYTYAGDALCPVSGKTEYGSEYFYQEQNYRYEYLSFDPEGNWLKRKVTCKEITEEFEDVTSEKSTKTVKDKVYTETRKIEYFY